jgi:hypothetical protein
MQQSAFHIADLPTGVFKGDRLPAAETFPTGLAPLDAILPHGGIPRGRLTEIHGPLMGGRLTIALALLRQCLQRGERTAFIDLPHTFYPLTLPQNGANSLLVIRPGQADKPGHSGSVDSGSPANAANPMPAPLLQPNIPNIGAAGWKQAFRAAEILVRSREWSLVILDLTGHPHQLPDTWLQRLAREARASRAAVLLLHDQRANPLASAIGLRLEVCRTGAAEGRALRVRITKNKLAAPNGLATIHLGQESEAFG